MAHEEATTPYSLVQYPTPNPSAHRVGMLRDPNSLRERCAGEGRTGQTWAESQSSRCLNITSRWGSLCTSW